MDNFKDILIFGEKIRAFSNGNIYRFGRNIKYPDGHYQHCKGYFPKQSTTTYGYKQINITDSNHKKHHIHVHDIIASCFCPNDSGYKEVHHIDGNKENNEYTNLMWCSRKFNMNEMVKFYNKKKQNYYCKDCGRRVSSKATYCIYCVRKHASNKVISKLPDSEIKEVLVRNKGNFTKSAKVFGITDNALRKRCIKLGIPDKSSYYK